MKALKSMQNNTSLGNNALRKEFGDAFWNEIKSFHEFYYGSKRKKEIKSFSN